MEKNIEFKITQAQISVHVLFDAVQNIYIFLIKHSYIFP